MFVCVLSVLHCTARYLIEIHTVNVVNKTAIIVYRTGEVEELNLSEIANEGHMSLIEM